MLNITQTMWTCYFNLVHTHKLFIDMSYRSGISEAEWQMMRRVSFNNATFAEYIAMILQMSHPCIKLHLWTTSRANNGKDRTKKIYKSWENLKKKCLHRTSPAGQSLFVMKCLEAMTIMDFMQWWSESHYSFQKCKKCNISKLILTSQKK